jgi:hypothetical protein
MIVGCFTTTPMQPVDARQMFTSGTRQVSEEHLLVVEKDAHGESISDDVDEQWHEVSQDGTIDDKRLRCWNAPVTHPAVVGFLS